MSALDMRTCDRVYTYNSEIWHFTDTNITVKLLLNMPKSLIQSTLELNFEQNVLVV